LFFLPPYEPNRSILDFAQLTAQTIEQHNGTVDWAVMADFDAPSYNQDIQANEGFPPGAEEFRRRLEATDAFVIVSPEYNASFPGALKNTIDWVSRVRPQPFHARHGLLLSASPSMAGGNRGLWGLRVPLEHLGARVFPDMFSLAQAHQAYRRRRAQRQCAAQCPRGADTWGIHGAG
jgi:chromate reductase